MKIKKTVFMLMAQDMERATASASMATSLKNRAEAKGPLRGKKSPSFSLSNK